jgi:hypothetical protein
MTRKEHSLCSYCDVVVQGWDSNLSILKLLSEDRKLESASELTARMNVLPVPNETRNTSVF